MIAQAQRIEGSSREHNTNADRNNRSQSSQRDDYQGDYPQEQRHQNRGGYRGGNRGAYRSRGGSDRIILMG